MSGFVKFYGADYYPEHWPEERWTTDARLMREAGFNVVRMAEFAWAKTEPSEGVFDFDWLKRVVSILQGEGVQSVIGTPTASAPAWLMQAHPEIFLVDEQGRRAPFGGRQFMCVNAPAFREASRRITRAMAGELGANESVIGWQIDNEFGCGATCYCDICRGEFQRWLEKKYGSLDALNDAWGTVFWSQTYSDWAQIPVPFAYSAANPGLFLDYKRFVTDSHISFAEEQIGIIREHSPERFITHNFMGMVAQRMDYHRIAEVFDFVTWDNYPLGFWATENPEKADPANVAAMHDFTRGMKRKPFWVMEEQSGPTGWGSMSAHPLPGSIRRWAQQAIAHGAEGVVYFRWRPCRFGTEQYWHGILNHDGSTNRRYEEVKQLGAEIARGDVPEPQVDQAKVAILFDYDSVFAFQYQNVSSDFDYVKHLLTYYKAFYHKGIPVDILPPNSDLSGYSIVVAPALYVLKPDVAKSLEEYVNGGGTLITTFRSGVKDEFSRIVDEPLPGLIRRVCGVEVEEYGCAPKGEDIRVKGLLLSNMPDEPVQAGVFMDVLRPTTAQVIAEYAGEYPGGKPAITRNQFGDGWAVYVGTWVDEGTVIGCVPPEVWDGLLR